MTDAPNAQRTLTSQLQLTARTKQLPKPDSGQLKLLLKSPPQKSNTRCPKSGERNNDFVYVKRVDPNGMCIDVHKSSLAVTTDKADDTSE